MRTSDVLEAAAAVIEARGHFKGGYLGWGGSVCAAGAIRCVIGINLADPPRALLLDERKPALALARGVSGSDDLHTIPEWNDAPERTAAEVIAMLRAVACTERARERTEIAPRLLPVVREMVYA